MSVIEYQRCDQCGKEVDDHYAEPDWTQVTISRLSIYAGRGEDRTARTKYYQRQGDVKMDFCGKGCFFDYLEGCYRGKGGE